jgi:hypothetical protein
MMRASGSQLSVAIALGAVIPFLAIAVGITTPTVAAGTGIASPDVGGDTVADAVPIPSIPFTDTGSTCGFTDDYDEMCPYGGQGPDVVYRYEPTVLVRVTLDLCASSYDTKMYVWEDQLQHTIACNDDAGCGYNGYQSRIEGVYLSPGHVYYIIVDGYGSSCGDYQLDLSDTTPPPCDLTCPPEAVPEGEPPCADGHSDLYNSGCDGAGWTALAAAPGGCALVCGRSCTYAPGGVPQPDRDWFEAVAVGGPVTVGCVAELPVMVSLFYGADCSNIFQQALGMADPCETATVAHAAEPGQTIWIWVRPLATGGAAESEYLLTVCGIQSVPGACCLPDGACHLTTWSQCGESGGAWNGALSCEPNPCIGVPVERISWGRVKERYR